MANPQIFTTLSQDVPYDVEYVSEPDGTISRTITLRSDEYRKRISEQLIDPGYFSEKFFADILDTVWMHPKITGFVRALRKKYPLSEDPQRVTCRDSNRRSNIRMLLYEFGYFELWDECEKLEKSFSVQQSSVDIATAKVIGISRHFVSSPVNQSERGGHWSIVSLVDGLREIQDINGYLPDTGETLFAKLVLLIDGTNDLNAMEAIEVLLDHFPQKLILEPVDSRGETPLLRAWKDWIANGYTDKFGIAKRRDYLSMILPQPSLDHVDMDGWSIRECQRVSRLHALWNAVDAYEQSSRQKVSNSYS